MEERDRRVRHDISQQTDPSPSGDSDPAGETLLADYLSQVDEAAARVITPQKTDDLLLCIKIEAARRAVLKRHQAEGDALANLILQRDLPAQAKPVLPPASVRQGRTRLRLAAGAQLAATAIVLLQLRAVSTSTMSDMALILTITAACLLAALMLWRTASRAELPASWAVPSPQSSRRHRGGERRGHLSGITSGDIT